MLFGSALLVALGVTACGGRRWQPHRHRLAGRPLGVGTVGRPRQPVPGCLVVEADNGRWELAATLPEGLRVGDRVVVAGRPAPEVEGACGAPVIRVREVRPA